MDYLVCVILIASPWLFGFADASDRAAVYVPVVLGLGGLLYSLMTRYELGAVRTIPMSTHLMLDIGSGMFLAASPWLFGFSNEVWMPHVIFGLLEIGTALFTEAKPHLIENGHGGFAITHV
jgi:hypothetical protein